MLMFGGEHVEATGDKRLPSAPSGPSGDRGIDELRAVFIMALTAALDCEDLDEQNLSDLVNALVDDDLTSIAELRMAFALKWM